MTTPQDDEPAVSYSTYAEFGARFFQRAVTEERVAAAAAGLAGRPVDFGPLGVGPMGIVKVSAHGRVGQPVASPVEGEFVAYHLSLPVDLALLIDMGLEKSRFNAVVTVRLSLTARPADPLKVVIDIEPPTRRDVEIRMQAEGLRASVLQLFAPIESEVRKSVARYVAAQLRRPEIAAARVIDVGAVLDSFRLSAH
ncbi:hypothetical protein [Jatrophihabitans sp.]|uniref:hypothetical protein n=1 Tax=Jatrophihabitans sp. TaxID=1932789 RepID=UPI0030C6DD69|nr:hypothetical protein [Jatrophihabitans sp.]